MSMTAPFVAPEIPNESEDLGFPLATPLAQMTDAQRANYWRHQSKKQQQRLEAALEQFRQTIEAFTQT